MIRQQYGTAPFTFYIRANVHEACDDLHDSLGEVGEEQVGLVTLTLAMLYWLVVEESVQFHRLVRRRTVLVLTTRHDHKTPTLMAKFHHAILVADRSEAGRRPVSSC